MLRRILQTRFRTRGPQRGRLSCFRRAKRACCCEFVSFFPRNSMLRLCSQTQKKPYTVRVIEMEPSGYATATHGSFSTSPNALTMLGCTSATIVLSSAKRKIDEYMANTTLIQAITPRFRGFWPPSGSDRCSEPASATSSRRVGSGPFSDFPLRFDRVSDMLSTRHKTIGRRL